MVKAHDIVKQTEAEFCTFIEDTLRQFGWRFYHQRTSIDPRRKGAWRTAMTGDKGLPDYIAVRPPRLLFIEAKGTTGVLSEDQREWRALLKECEVEGGCEVYTWWPRDHELVLEVLR